MIRKIQIKENFLTNAELSPTSLDKKARTVEVIFSTGAKGLRSQWFGEPYYEELSLDPTAVRLDWMNSGQAPFLDSHNTNSITSQIGIIENAQIIDDNRGANFDKKKKMAVAKVRFSERAEVDAILSDIEAGILKNISVGYRVYKYEQQPEDASGIPTYLATDWQPLEASLVTIPFDQGATVRSSDQYDCEIINNTNGETKMEENRPAEAEKLEVRAAVKEPVEVKVPAVDVEKLKKETIEIVRQDELKRFELIQDACRKAGFESEAEKMFKDGKTIDEARASILDKLADSSKQNQTQSVHVEVGRDVGRESRIAGATEALLYRSNSRNNKLTEIGKPFYYSSLMDLARECLDASGVSSRVLSPNEIATRVFHSTSDFPIILENVLNKSLREGYATLPRTFEPFIRQRPLRDFKVSKSLQKGPAPELLLKPEGAEIKAGTISEGSESYQLRSYARKINVTREVLINDDLSAFSSIPADLGQRIADLENDLFWELILTPQTMSDGKALFHVDHGNLGTTSGKPSIATLNKARQKGREQKDIDGARKINIDLSWLVVAPEDETVAQQLVVDVMGQNFSPEAIANLNPFAGRLKPLVEPRLATSGTQPFYVFADAGRYPMAEKGILQGQEAGPQTTSYLNMETKGVSFDILYDVVFHVVDYRGFIKMPGA